MRVVVGSYGPAISGIILIVLITLICVLASNWKKLENWYYRKQWEEEHYYREEHKRLNGGR